MRTILVMFDSLNRRFLPNYGCDWVKAPNFERLGRHCVTFDNAYVGSMPCMPARREMHTGRYNFLHRSWGPMEPFDDSAPQILKNNGVYSHLVSDHQHYWEDGGATYHTRFSSWENFRGQEGDPWKADLNPAITPEHQVEPSPAPKSYAGMARFQVQDVINRGHMDEEGKMPQPQTFAAGLEFLKTNYRYDNWFLQIETFDPHEPFFTPKEYQALYEEVDVGRDIDWPPYGPCRSSEEVVRHVRHKYAALVSMCDKYLGKVLDFMDNHDMWKDTALIVTTDHGYLLGEHQWWAKSIMPLYNEIAHIPMFAWDPRCGKKGERRQTLVQNIDLAPTVLELNGIPVPPDMLGKPIAPAVDHDETLHDCVLFGHHGTHVNITDGRYVYMRAPLTRENGPVYEYTLMPTHMRAMFSPEELKGTKLHPPFSFTKGVPVLQIESGDPQAKAFPFYRYGTRLYDLQNDPGELHPIEDEAVELRMIHRMVELMKENDAPREQYDRLGLPFDHEMTAEELRAQKAWVAENDRAVPVEGWEWTPEAKEQFLALAMFTGKEKLPELFRAYMKDHPAEKVGCPVVEAFAMAVTPEASHGPVLNVLNVVARRS